MEKCEELEKAVLDICVCGEIMQGVGKRLADVFGVALPGTSPREAESAESATKEAEKPAKKKTVATEQKKAVVPEESVPTLEEIRAVLAQKSIEGLTDKVKELIASYGVKRLSDVPPEKYADLLKKAEGIGNGK